MYIYIYKYIVYIYNIINPYAQSQPLSPEPPDDASRHGDATAKAVVGIAVLERFGLHVSGPEDIVLDDTVASEIRRSPPGMVLKPCK